MFRINSRRWNSNQCSWLITYCSSLCIFDSWHKFSAHSTSLGDSTRGFYDREFPLRPRWPTLGSFVNHMYQLCQSLSRFAVPWRQNRHCWSLYTLDPPPPPASRPLSSFCSLFSLRKTRCNAICWRAPRRAEDTFHTQGTIWDCLYHITNGNCVKQLTDSCLVNKLLVYVRFGTLIPLELQSRKWKK
jgi:hypothetical protein